LDLNSDLLQISDRQTVITIQSKKYTPNTTMTAQTPEDIIAMFVSGLLREKRFNISASDDATGYEISIETPSRNQGRILGGQRTTLDYLIALARRIDKDIKIKLLDPNEAAEKSEINITDPLIAVQAFIDFIGLTEDVIVVDGDAGKTTIHDRNTNLNWDVRNAITCLAFNIGRANRQHCEIAWE
jgi:hypothetical protein